MKKGYITIFFALIFMVLVSFILSIFTGIKISAYKLKAECAYSVASNAVLGEYHADLLERYDLFYVDTSYRTGVPDYHQVEAHLWEYIEKNMGIPPVSAEIREIVLATDQGGIPYRKQISAYMQDKIGMSYIRELSDLFQTVSKEGYLKEDLTVQNPWEKKWQDALSQRENIPEKTWKEIQKISPIEKSYSVRESFVLNQVAGEKTQLSNKNINNSDLVSNREVITGTGCKDELDLTDKIYFIGYLFEKFSYYTEEQNDRVLNYELEYLLGDGGSDYENLSMVAKKLIALRECINLTYLLSDNERMVLVKELSAALSLLIASPELAPVFEALIIGLWVYVESLNDVKILFSGGNVPLIKAKETWTTDLEGGLNLEMITNSFQNSNEDMGYRQYLEILLLFAKDEKITLRSMDLIEMNIRELAGNETFRMDGLAEDFLLNLVFEIPWFGSYQIVRRFSYAL